MKPEIIRVKEEQRLLPDITKIKYIFNMSWFVSQMGLKYIKTLTFHSFCICNMCLNTLCLLNLQLRSWSVKQKQRIWRSSCSQFCKQTSDQALAEITINAPCQICADGQLERKLLIEIWKISFQQMQWSSVALVGQQVIDQKRCCCCEPHRGAGILDKWNIKSVLCSRLELLYSSEGRSSVHMSGGRHQEPYITFPSVCPIERRSLRSGSIWGVITVKGWVGSEGGEGGQGLSPRSEEEDEWNLNNHIKPAASHSLISIDWMQHKSERFRISICAVCLTEIRETLCQLYTANNKNKIYSNSLGGRVFMSN